MTEDAQTLLLRLRGILLPGERFPAPVASVLMLLAAFSSSRPLRVLIFTVALTLFLVVAADISRSLLDRENGYVSLQGPPKDIPVDVFQVVLTIVIGAFYAAMILSGFYVLLLRSVLAWFVLVPGTCVLSGLAAWRNVRLWYREGADYEQALEEEAGQSHRLRIPPVR